MSTTKKNNEKAPRSSPPALKSVPPKPTPPEKEPSLQQRVEAEREAAAAELVETKPNPVVFDPLAANKPELPKVLIPPAPPLSETERLQKRVTELESELLHIQRNASVDFTRLAKVLKG